jgi:rhodanese-related sulfurtransferase
MASETTESELDIDAADAAEKVAAGAQLIDVRQDYEWEAGRIPGAEHIPLERLPAASERLDRDRPIVFQCRTGSRSGLAAQVFRASGFEAYNLAGGLHAWVEAGRELEPAGGLVADPRPDAG